MELWRYKNVFFTSEDPTLCYLYFVQCFMFMAFIQLVLQGFERKLQFSWEWVPVQGLLPFTEKKPHEMWAWKLVRMWLIKCCNKSESIKTLQETPKSCLKNMRATVIIGLSAQRLDAADLIKCVCATFCCHQTSIITHRGILHKHLFTVIYFFTFFNFAFPTNNINQQYVN